MTLAMAQANRRAVDHLFAEMVKRLPASVEGRRGARLRSLAEGRVAPWLEAALSPALIRKAASLWGSVAPDEAGRQMADSLIPAQERTADSRRREILAPLAQGFILGARETARSLAKSRRVLASQLSEWADAASFAAEDPFPGGPLPPDILEALWEIADYVEPVPDYIRQWSWRRAGWLIRDVDETTREDVRNLVESALRSGDSGQAVSDSLFGSRSTYPRSRSNLIGMMEVQNALSEGARIEAVSRDAQEKRVINGRHNVRPAHAALGALGWVARDHEYSGVEFPGQRNPFGYNCHCTVVYRGARVFN